MNTEVIKAMNKQDNTKREQVRKWWSKNGYKVARVVLFPLWVGILASDKLEAWLNSRVAWSEERADEILSYYIPRRTRYCAEDKAFYFFDNGMGWGYASAKKYVKLKDRRFWKIHCGFWGGKLRTYLVNEFELEGFTKEVINTSDGWTEINFFLNEK